LVKGISTILATILIVVIVVALVSLTYTFATSLFGTSTKGVDNSVTEATKKMDQRIIFVTDPECEQLSNGNWSISFTIRHDGSSYSISENQITALFGNDMGTISGWGSEPLAPGGIKSLKFWNTTAVTWRTTDLFTVSAPAGSIVKTIACS
jgi:hypothetical protein